MKKILIAFAMLFTVISSTAQAVGELPAGSIGTVNQTTTYQYQNFSFNFTAPTSGVDYFGLAFRQDPGYWSVGNFNLHAAGSSTNLLANPNLQYGGGVSGYGLQAPADWGVWYQSLAGAPPAAGYWAGPGQGWYGSYTGGLGVNTSTAGSWIDGAVGTYDGIYQGFNATAGTTYNFSFTSLGTNSYSNPSIMIGVYAGSCAAGGTVFSCTPVSSSGFTAAATPQQTQGTGGAPPPPPPSGGGTTTPTRQSETTTNQVTTTVTYGNPTTTTTYQTRTVYTTNSAGNQIVQTFTDTVTQTVTPVYTTTTTTPVTTVTWSDGTTTTEYGTPTTTTTTTYQTSPPTTTYDTTPTSTAPWICCGGSASSFNANSGNIVQVQNFASRVTNDSKVYIQQVGDGNRILVDQEGTKNNYAYVSNAGSNNNITVTQKGNASTITNYAYTNLNGNSDIVNVTQTSTGGAKGAFITASGNSNNVSVTQTDSGSHYAEIGLTGGNKTVNLTQSGSASQMASIQLSGNPTSLTLQQTGATQNFYSIQFNCATAGGCTPINVKQGN